MRASANDYKERGRQYNPENITVKRSLGEGSFGQVGWSSEAPLRGGWGGGPWDALGWHVTSGLPR